MFRNAIYVGVFNQGEGSIQSGPGVGTATEPACEEPGEPEDASARVPVSAVVGVPPTTAIIRDDRPDLLYVARLQCHDVGRWPTFRRCLSEQLHYNGRKYVALRLARGLAEYGLTTTGRASVARLATANDSRPIDVALVSEIDAAAAVASVRDDGLIFVADGLCYDSGDVAELVACLKHRKAEN